MKLLFVILLFSSFSAVSEEWMTFEKYGSKAEACPKLEALLKKDKDYPIRGAGTVIRLDKEIAELRYLGHRRFYDSNQWTWTGSEYDLSVDDFCSYEGVYFECWILKVKYLEEPFSCGYRKKLK